MILVEGLIIFVFVILPVLFFLRLWYLASKIKNGDNDE